MREDTPLRIAVIGSGTASSEEEALAREVGGELARRGAILLCGGLGGVMMWAARGCREGGGRTIGLLPGSDPAEANPWIEIPMATGMGEARNVLIVRAAEAIVAVGGAWGTLSEIALARQKGTPVVTLGRPPADGLDVPAAADAAGAAAWAVERVLAARTASARGGK